MNAGYVRLSRDDDKRNYISIENQKLIITQFAQEQGGSIDLWYEDDGISGYKFDRPGFLQLLADLDHTIDTVYVKDFSRLGRHNAKVLLLLEEFRERGKRLIVIDDNYDSSQADDDTIGIKTWYNERYVKDTSKKIKRALSARQKAGTLVTQPPFGYQRSEKDNTQLEILPKEAECITLIYNLYLKGSGYRRISHYLTEHRIPTPSLLHHERELAKGRLSKRMVASVWSDSMVKDILRNDFYIGTLRLRKRARSTVHGKDKRIPLEEQYVFENHHPAIIAKNTYEAVQTMKQKRANDNYRGNGTHTANIFSNFLFCSNCGSHLTPIKRTTSSTEHKYYICSAYNTKGKLYCPKSHRIEETELMKDIISYLLLCRTLFSETISAYALDSPASKAQASEKEKADIQKKIDVLKEQLLILLTQKIKDISGAGESEAMISESYDALQKNILAQIHHWELRLNEMLPTQVSSEAEATCNALQILDKIIQKGMVDRYAVEAFIERIEVDENGCSEITLKYGLGDSRTSDSVKKINQCLHEAVNSRWYASNGVRIHPEKK